MSLNAMSTGLCDPEAALTIPFYLKLNKSYINFTVNPSLDYLKPHAICNC